MNSTGWAGLTVISTGGAGLTVISTGGAVLTVISRGRQILHSGGEVLNGVKKRMTSLWTQTKPDPNYKYCNS